MWIDVWDVVGVRPLERCLALKYHSEGLRSPEVEVEEERVETILGEVAYETGDAFPLVRQSGGSSSDLCLGNIKESQRYPMFPQRIITSKNLF